MIRFISIWFLILFVVSAPGQNIFDRPHSVSYADYLYNSGEYELAAQEYLRISFDNNHPHYKLRLLKSYRLAGKPSVEYALFYKFYPNNTFPNDTFAFEFLRMNMALQLKPNLNTILTQYRFESESHKNIFMLASLLYTDQWKKAGQTAQSLTGHPKSTMFEKLAAISEQASRIKFKKPWLAGSLSAIVPGSGKVYSGYFWDGLMSLLFVGSNAFLAYRGFSKYGTSSGLGWTFSGLSAFFYLGNIYGSIKAAKRKNNERRHAIYQKVNNILDSGF